AEDNPGVGVILPGTAHVAFSAQPADEALIASRCASWINGAVYRKPGIAATGPMFERLDLNFNEAT
ncbi:MAG TPA: hypothetical protein DCS43_02145, partial [Verrucomicrobia bacterium]|nr:hypothetical protein [Verrucomicrobiota bacterium]